MGMLTSASTAARPGRVAQRRRPAGGRRPRTAQLREEAFFELGRATLLGKTHRRIGQRVLLRRVLGKPRSAGSFARRMSSLARTTVGATDWSVGCAWALAKK